MTANEIWGEGIAFSNLHDIWLCRRFVRLVDQGEYEKAADMLDFSLGYQSLQKTLSEDPALSEEDHQFLYYLFGDVLNMTYEEYADQELQKIVRKLQEKDPMDKIRDYGYDRAYRVGDDWIIEYRVVESVENPNKTGLVEVSQNLILGGNLEEQLTLYSVFDGRLK